MPIELPAPDAAALALSARLSDLIRTEIAAHGGSLDFGRFMELALYAPGLGYYSAGAAKFGAAGDFVTAPELGALFAQCLAQALAPTLARGGDALELGPGSGALAADLLLAWERLGCLPARYRLLERSAELRARQQATLAARCPHVLARCEWLDAPPAAPWNGVLVANEVLDALPVRLFELRDAAAAPDFSSSFRRTPQSSAFGSDSEGLDTGVRRDDEQNNGERSDDERNDAQEIVARAVGVDANGAFVWREVPADAALARAVEETLGAAAHRLPRPYRSEICPLLAPWFDAVTQTLQHGTAVFVDYGYERTEYYAPQRHEGTLRCHYRHRAHDDPLIHVGLQDITAWVDFDALAQAARAQGWETAPLTTQAHWMIENGIDAAFEAAYAQAPGEAARYALAQQVKRLMLPGQMGEAFKVQLLRR